jgi:hypothetical protein
VEASGHVICREKLLIKDSTVAKRCLAMLVDEIVLKDEAATMTGRHAAVASTLQVIAGARQVRCPESYRIGAPGEIRTPDR